MRITLSIYCEEENWNRTSQAVLATSQSSSLQTWALLCTGAFSSGSHKTCENFSQFQQIQDSDKALPANPQNTNSNLWGRALALSDFTWATYHYRSRRKKPVTPLQVYVLLSSWHKLLCERAATEVISAAFSFHFYVPAYEVRDFEEAISACGLWTILNSFSPSTDKQGQTIANNY